MSAKVVHIKRNGVTYGLKIEYKDREKFYTAPGCGLHATPQQALEEFLLRKKKIQSRRHLRKLASSWGCKLELSSL